MTDTFFDWLGADTPEIRLVAAIMIVAVFCGIVFQVGARKWI